MRRSVLPSSLTSALGSASAAGTGDMVLVKIDWSSHAWSLPNVVPAANASNNSAANQPLVSHVAIALARSEPPG